MDVHTKRNLELTETLRLKQRQYSLLWLLDKTKTAMGSRMLKNYIENPLIDTDEINKRYNIAVIFRGVTMCFIKERVWMVQILINV